MIPPGPATAPGAAGAAGASDVPDPLGAPLAAGAPDPLEAPSLTLLPEATRRTVRAGGRRRAAVIMRQDLRQLRQSRDFWVPLMIIAVFMFLVVPVAILSAIPSVHDPALVEKLGSILGRLPHGIRYRLLAHGATPQTEAAYTIAVYLVAPLVTLVPLTVSSAVGASAFVGERERGSGEFLAHSPASSTEIFLGKLGACCVPAFLTVGAGFLGYTLVVNLTLGPRLGGWFFPTGNWWLLIGWVIPPLVILATALICIVSSRVTTGAAAQQAASVIALPLVIIAFTVANSALFGHFLPALFVGAALWLGSLGAVAGGARTLTRARLLGMNG